MKHKKIKRSNAPNKKEQAAEIFKCGTDIGYFLSRYAKIPHPMKGLIKFKAFPFQIECLEAFQKHRHIIVNKSRQLGLSTSAAAYALWLAIFQREKNILIVATKLDTAINFIHKVKTILNNLPGWLVMPKLVEDTKKSLAFNNGSKIKAVPTSSDVGRSEALSLLIIDEAAHVEGINELWLGLGPTLSTGGSVILISTPSGVGTLFHDLWIEAQKGENDFYPIELPWTVHPERDEKWFEKEKKALIQAKGERGVSQELLCSFMSSGDTFLKGDVMDRLFKEIENPIEKIPHGRHEAWIWKRPVSDHKYIIGADVARGDGEDYSTFHIIDTTTEEVVADYQGKPPPDKFAEIMIQYGQMYNTALICQELNSVGVACATKLKESNYPNLYYEKFQKNIYMTYYNKEIGPEDFPGFTVNPKTREQLLAKLENSLRNKHIKVRSKRLYEELQTFIWKNNKPQAQKRKNDDLVMALAIGCNIFEFSGKTHINNNDAQWALVKGMSVQSTKMDPNTGERTVDGFWGVPDKVAVKDKDHLQRQIDHQKLKSFRHPRTHNYNDSIWDSIRWIFDD